MLSDEEKKAIDDIKRELTDKDRREYMNKWFADDLQILVNLIEKQSKEIEKLKAEKDKYYYEWKHLEANMINKIKAKIEEVEQWELYNMKIPRLSTLDERLGAKIGIKYVLQSLLEKE